ncbi:hypothetical protein EBS67_12110, partial [bacterium]|nr:hypothetical protein [bacterium]
LPNVVLFPRVIQPLHIFEPRYKQMVEDALEDNRLIALCLLQPTAGLGGSTSPIYPDICIGQILQEERLPDGRFNLLLQGVSRAKIIKEVNNGKLYRTAKVEILHDVPNSSVENEDRMRTRLVKRMTKWFTQQPSAKEQLDRLVNSDLSLGNLCDVFSFALPLSVDMKILLLQLVNVEDRASLLLEVIEQMTPEVTKQPSSSAPSKKYPPDFSAN